MTHALMADDLLKKGYSYAVLVDIRKAYDSVSHDKLMDLLRIKGLSNTSLCLIRSLFFTDCQTKLSINRARTVSIPFERGIMQGCPLSPILFGHYIDPLANAITASNQENALHPILMYFDDVLLLSKSHGSMQTKLNICSEWGKDSLLGFNIQKTVLLCQHNSEPLLLDGQQVKLVEKAKYLGIPFNANGAEWVEYGMQQVDRADQMLMALRIMARECTHALRIRLYKLYALPLMVYCSPCIHVAMNLNNEDKKLLLEKWKQHDKNVLSMIFNKDNIERYSLLQSMAQILPFHVRVQFLRTSFLFHLNQMPDYHPWFVISAPSSELVANTPTTVCQLISITNVLMHDFENERRSRHRLTWMGFRLDRQAKTLNEVNRVLPWYISDQARNALWKADAVLMEKNKKLREYAVNWRLGYLFFQRKCFLCGEQFKRSHVMICDYQLHMDIQLFDDDIWENVRVTNEHLQRMSVVHKFNYQGHYCFLDAMLNLRKYDQFLKAVNYLSEKMNSTDATDE
jgi:hypothetical protein